MLYFAKGLRLTVTNRDEFKQYVVDTAVDPAIYLEAWGDNSVPEAIHIVSVNIDDDGDYYLCVNSHVNGVKSSVYYGSELLENAIELGMLEKDGYDVELVEECI